MEMGVERRNGLIATLGHNYIDADILEWTGIRPRTILNLSGDLMFDCMRRWPESIEGEFNLAYFLHIMQSGSIFNFTIRTGIRLRCKLT